MGDITVIEFDSDRIEQVKADPQGLVEAILEQLRTQRLDGMSIPGGQVVKSFPPSGHHDHRSWLRWKREHGATYKGIYALKRTPT